LTLALFIALQPTARGQDELSRPTSGPSLSAVGTGRSVSIGDRQPTESPLSLENAIDLALRQVSTFRQAELNQFIAQEELAQARAAFRPRVQLGSSYIYTSPSGMQGATAPSFIAANAINEYQLLLSVGGEVDLSGRLRANLGRARALLEAARAGTEAARRELIFATTEAYYQLALTTARRQAAERNLAAAEEFERITRLLLSGGEVAPVDLVRAQVQTATRRDELERARTEETVAANLLRALIGYSEAQPIAVRDLLAAMPQEGELERYAADLVQQRPELAQLEAERRASLEEARLARAERRPQITYSFGGGSDSSSLFHAGQNAGLTATVGLAIPIFDWGASRSRERQALLRAQVTDSELALARRRFIQEFNDARAQALAALRRLRTIGESVKAAESNLRTSIARYRAGEASIIEVTDAQTTLVAQQAALYQAIYDYQVARARLKQATGK
jgi:outer membrane protein TolC